MKKYLWLCDSKLISSINNESTRVITFLSSVQQGKNLMKHYRMLWTSCKFYFIFKNAPQQFCMDFARDNKHSCWNSYSFCRCWGGFLLGRTALMRTWEQLVFSWKFHLEDRYAILWTGNLNTGHRCAQCKMYIQFLWLNFSELATAEVPQE